MTLVLKPEMLEAAYEYLKTTPPFRRWKLPAADDVEFRIAHHEKYSGEWTRRTAKNNKSHIITIFANRLATFHDLLNTMGHEMLHLYQSEAKTETRTIHNSQFAQLMDRVCRVHGFNERLF